MTQNVSNKCLIYFKIKLTVFFIHIVRKKKTKTIIKYAFLFLFFINFFIFYKNGIIWNFWFKNTLVFCLNYYFNFQKKCITYIKHILQKYSHYKVDWNPFEYMHYYTFLLRSANSNFMLVILQPSAQNSGIVIFESTIYCQ